MRAFLFLRLYVGVTGVVLVVCMVLCRMLILQRDYTHDEDTTIYIPPKDHSSMTTACNFHKVEDFFNVDLMTFLKCCYFQ